MSEQSETLLIDGMTCEHCVRHVRVALERLPGLRVGRVLVGSAEIMSEHPLDLAVVAGALEAEGYTLRKA